jgi:hypothetical protein
LRNVKAESMQITFTQHRGNPVSLVLVDGAVVGALRKRQQLGRGFSKSMMSTRHVTTWTPTVCDIAELDLDDDERRAVELHITRSKTSRRTAVVHLLAAYELAGIELPKAQRERREAA